MTAPSMVHRSLKASGFSLVRLSIPIGRVYCSTLYQNPEIIDPNPSLPIRYQASIPYMEVGKKLQELVANQAYDDILPLLDKILIKESYTKAKPYNTYSHVIL